MVYECSERMETDLQKKAVKKGLFQIVQAVARELGDYTTDSMILPGTNVPSLCTGYFLIKAGLRAAVGYRQLYDNKYGILGHVSTHVSINVNGKEMFHASIDQSSIEQYVQTYEPGDWEKQLRGFYEQALHMKSARKARTEGIRQRIRAAGNRRSASIW
ncbi:MAG TPA: hypothetical protein HA362_03310 [Nanoarchaeota archaeon]|nr:hypothetical protein [Nanoarchaeota archaeon]